MFKIPFLVDLAVNLLKGITNIVGNYGVAIIILTIMMRILIFPLTLKQEKSMKKMREIQPELDKLKEKYKDNPQEFQKRTAEVYKENGVNPLGGCLPLLIQMPIFVALYYALIGNAIPNDATFLWFNLLPILNTAATFVQQKIMTGSTGDKQENNPMQSMLYTMPLMMLFIFYRMPSGVTLYYLFSTIFSVIQQYFIMKGRN